MLKRLPFLLFYFLPVNPMSKVRELYYCQTNQYIFSTFHYTNILMIIISPLHIRVQNPIKLLRWNVLRKIVNGLKLESAKLSALRAHVPTFLACLCARVATCLACLTCSRANVPCVLTCSRGNVPCVLCVPTCSRDITKISLQ